MTDSLQHPYAQALAWALVHFVWQGAAIGLVAFAAAAARARSCGVGRYAIGVAALAAMLVAPVVTYRGASPSGVDAGVSSAAGDVRRCDAVANAGAARDRSSRPASLGTRRRCRRRRPSSVAGDLALWLTGVVDPVAAPGRRLDRRAPSGAPSDSAGRARDSGAGRARRRTARTRSRRLRSSSRRRSSCR